MSGPGSQAAYDDDALARDVAAHPLWYHTLTLRPGLTTPGWFDLRPVADALPWPDVAGKRCLDVGTYDGFLAFELERRGAGEVVAADVASHEDWDFPVDVRAGGVAMLNASAGVKGRGFEIAARALGSRVRKVEVSAYDLSPQSVGTFDVVVCGSLLLHLRDPFRALEAMRSVCGGALLSCEQIDATLTLLHRRTPITTLAGLAKVQWHVPNLAGHRRMVAAAGFAVERVIPPYAIPFGAAHPPVRASRLRRAACRRVTGGWGVPHSAVLARA